MRKKGLSFFYYKTIARSLCLLALTSSSLPQHSKIHSQLDDKITYTMNFRNINIVEYIRFVAKISKTNFIFNEAELNFPVTLVSDQPVSAKNLFAALAQVLEVNGFTLSDQEGSVFITKNPGSSQLGAINQLSAPLITRIYNIRNLNLLTITQIVKSVVSKGALVESLVDTHQIIVTDTGPSLDKLGQLIHDLDSSGSNLKIMTYKVKSQSPNALAETLKQIMTPFVGLNPYITIPQTNNNQLIIVSTPYLVQQTQDALLSVDIPDAQIPIEPSSGGIFLYAPEHRKPSDIRASLLIMAETLAQEGPSTQSLVAMIRSMKLPEASSSLVFVGSASTWTKLKEIIIALDSKNNLHTLFVYQIKSTNPEQLEEFLHQAATKAEDSGDPIHLAEAIDSMTYVASTNSLVFTGTNEAIEKLKIMLPEIDAQQSTKAGSSFFIYQLQHVSGDLVLQELKNFDFTGTQARTSGLSQTIETIKWLKNSNSLLIFGSEKNIQSVEQLIAKIDVSSSQIAQQTKSNFAIYKLKTANGEAIINQLHALGDEVDATSKTAKDNQEALKKSKFIADSNSIMIFGNAESIAFVEAILEKIDVPASATSGSSYAFYAVKGKNGKDIANKLHALASTLPQNTPHDKAIQKCLKSVKFISDTNSILIQGSEESIAFVQSVAEKMDEGMSVAPNTSFVVYALKGVSGEAVVAQLHDMALHITDSSSASQNIKSCLSTAKYLPDTNSIMISGTKEAITFAESILEKIDMPQAGTTGATFYLYKLQSQPGSKVIGQVQSFVSKLPSSTVADRNVIQSIKNLQWIQDNNAILISGNQQTIDRISALISQFDTQAPSTGDNKGDFLIYSPHFLSLDALEESMQEYAVALKQSGLADPNLLETINTAKSVPSANHLVFTGNTESITKVKSILALIDQEKPQSSIQQFGQTAFYVHQLKTLTPDQFSSMMKSFEANMTKNGTQDPQVAKAIDSMQYLKETNSFLFTGPQSALDKVAQIADKIDMSKSTSSSDMTYDIYNPKHVKGTELIEQMCQFAQGLSDSGIQDQTLFNAINNIKWIEKSNSMIITGSSESIAKIQDLLNKFDVEGVSLEKPALPSSGFMVYKLQYHAGTDIQTALNKLSPTFAANGPNPNPGLQAAINSIQWIQATNSLVASGDEENLEKLKTLISEIDMPLRQVFIEVLVIETDTTNTQNYGLQWFGKGQIKNQLGFGTGNFAGTNPISNGNTAAPNFSGPASGINLSTFPTGQSIPFYGNQGGGNTSGPQTPGFDLGVIGDVLFHKGQSFLSIGSLVNALQADSDSTIVMNPKIITQDNKNSTIFIGQNIPFIGSSVQNSSANTVNSANIEYRDVGTNLSITPKLGDDDVITLEITYSMSAQIPNTNGGQGGFNGIQTSQTNMTTRVHVPDQHFVVLSGMLSENKSHLKSGIPCLGGLPIIGLAFSETDRSSNKSNTLIFIRPCIVHNFEEYRDLTEKQENKYRDMLDRHIDKEEFDQGLNLLKEPIDE
jgi:type III secretion protein C